MPREIKALPPVIESSRSFDGLHEIVFNEKTHRYKWACDCHAKHSSVGTTTFIKASYPTSEGLINWRTDQAVTFAITSPDELDGLGLIQAARIAYKEPAQEAADIGTICHAYAELHSLGKYNEARILEEKVTAVKKWSVISSCINKYLDWSNQNQGKLIQAEGLIASPNYLYCGKFDRLDKVNGKVRLRDYKTSKSIYIDQFIQLAAYAIALKEWNNVDVEELEVLRFGKEDGTFEPLLISDKSEIQVFKDQAIRCRQTFGFLKLNNDPRFDWKKSGKQI